MKAISEIKDVVIIGGGPAGMAVADKLYDLGVRDIVLIEKEEQLGGVLSQCIHDGFGLIKLGQNITGPEYAELYRTYMKHKHIETIFSATAMEISNIEDKTLKRVVVATTEGECVYKARAVVLATGCRERGRGNLGIPGTRCAGIFTAGTAQAFINLKNLMPGKKVVIVGSGDIGLIMARRLTLEGAEVVCVVERESTYGGLKRNIKQCLEDFNIPLLTNTVVANAYGKIRVSGIDTAEMGADGKILGPMKHISCDTIIISAGLIPEDGILQTSSDGVFVCGNALFVHGLVDDVSNSGEEVALEIKEYLFGDSEKLKSSKYSAVNMVQTRKNQAEYLYKKKLEELEYRSQDTITCIKCPNGCEIDNNMFNGGKCSKGAEYAKEEITNPSRVLTSSIKVEGGDRQLTSVKTTMPIPKKKLFEAMQIIRHTSIEAPVKCGQIILENFIEKGVNLVATGTVEK